MYCLLIFAFIGGQLFGVMDFFCVKNNKTALDVTYKDLTYPIQRCPFTDKESRYCTPPYRCTRLNFLQRGQNVKNFNHILSRLLTVYEAMSLEGWSGKMFDAMELITDGEYVLRRVFPFFSDCRYFDVNFHVSISKQ